MKVGEYMLVVWLKGKGDDGLPRGIMCDKVEFVNVNAILTRDNLLVHVVPIEKLDTIQSLEHIPRFRQVR